MQCAALCSASPLFVAPTHSRSMSRTATVAGLLALALVAVTLTVSPVSAADRSYTAAVGTYNW